MIAICMSKVSGAASILVTIYLSKSLGAVYEEGNIQTEDEGVRGAETHHHIELC